MAETGHPARGGREATVSTADGARPAKPDPRFCRRRTGRGRGKAPAKTVDLDCTAHFDAIRRPADDPIAAAS
jgi:hypothetical protein